MANIRLIKGRIKSAKNISQITKAMELVAASKMKKAQSAAISGKSYADKIYEMTIRLAQSVKTYQHPLLKKPLVPIGKRLIVFLSTNKGLCGGLNTNLFRFFVREYESRTQNDYVTLGTKGADFLACTGCAVVADFSQITPFSQATSAIGEFVTREFLALKYDAVDLVYNDFISAIRQVPRRKTILPLAIESAGEAEQSDDQKNLNFKIEPSVKEVIDSLLPHYLENQIRDAILEAEASEHSARMVAMRNATDNAVSLTDELTLVYNKARQEKITYEITDLTTARIATEQ